MKSTLGKCCLLLLVLLLANATSTAEEKSCCTITLGDMQFQHIEIAATPEARTKGLMFRKEIPDDGGMLFIFPQEELLSFWMRNTLVPLDIVFINKQGIITAIHTMKAEPPQKANESNESYCSRLTPYSSLAPAIAALELNAGMAANLQTGDKLQIPQLLSIKGK